jgi:molybdopterin converting factor small subunit
MQVTVQFYSYFKDLTGSSALRQELAPGSTLGDLIDELGARFPKLGAMRKSMLAAVGVEYQQRGYVLQDDDEVSLFPPVQGG